MGQLCFKDEQIIENNAEVKIRVQSTINLQQTIMKSKARQTYAEDISSNNILRDIKITIKKDTSGDHDTEDENYQAEKSCTEESVKSEATISHHRNIDQAMEDISPANKNLVNDQLAESKAKSNSSKFTNTSKKTKASMRSGQMFTGTLGHNSYLDQSSMSNYAEDFDSASHKKYRSESQNNKRKIKPKQKESTLSQQN